MCLKPLHRILSTLPFEEASWPVFSKWVMIKSLTTKNLPLLKYRYSPNTEHCWVFVLTKYWSSWKRWSNNRSLSMKKVKSFNRADDSQLNMLPGPSCADNLPWCVYHYLINMTWSITTSSTQQYSITLINAMLDSAADVNVTDLSAELSLRP